MRAGGSEGGRVGEFCQNYVCTAAFIPLQMSKTTRSPCSSLTMLTSTSLKCRHGVGRGSRQLVSVTA